MSCVSRPFASDTSLKWIYREGTRQTRRVVNALFSNLVPRAFPLKHGGGEGRLFSHPSHFLRQKPWGPIWLLCWLSFPWSVQSVNLAFSSHLRGKRECRRQERLKRTARFVHAHLREKRNNENAPLYIIWTSGSFLKILSATSFSCRSTWLG